MCALHGPEEALVRSYDGTLVFYGESEINAVPQGQLKFQRQIERAKQSRRRFEQARQALGDQRQGCSGLFG